MTFYIVHNAMPRIRIKTYPTQRGAKIARARFNRNAGFDAYSIVSYQDYHANDVTVTVETIFGNKVEIAESVRGTACDPGMESYWSA
jgi:hypothetical protein